MGGDSKAGGLMAVTFFGVGFSSFIFGGGAHNLHIHSVMLFGMIG